MDFKNPLAQPGLCTANRRSIRDAQPWGGLERNLYEDSYIDLPCCGAYTANVNPDAERWRQLSAYDLSTADAMLASGRYLYVLFCNQQAVEKLIKAIIVERTGAFPPRTHDLIKLAQTAKAAPSEEHDHFLRTLTKYYIGTRYPEEISTLARDAERVCRTVSFPNEGNSEMDRDITNIESIAKQAVSL